MRTAQSLSLFVPPVGFTSSPSLRGDAGSICEYFKRGSFLLTQSPSALSHLLLKLL